MTLERPQAGRGIARSGLAEFESESATGLAPFEDESAIQLDEFGSGSPNLLDEFDEARYFAETPAKPEEEGEENAEQETEEPLEEENEDVEKHAKETEEPPAEEAVEEAEEEPPSEEEPVEEVPEPVPEPANPVIGFVCEHALDLAGVMDASGRMIGRERVHLIGVPCAGMVKPGWLQLALERGASGAFVVACAPGSCHHRTGSCILEGRWRGLRRPMLLSRCDRRRLELFMFQRAARNELLQAIDSFLARLAALDTPPEEVEELEKAPEVEEEAEEPEQPTS